MKRLIPFLFLAGLLLMTACSKGNYVTYSGVEAGTIDAGVFTSDSNKKMTVVGNEGNYDVRSARRVLIKFETHPITTDGHIEIDILGLLDAAIIFPDAVESLPEDPDGSSIQVTDAWFSTGYLNILISFPGTDETLHTITSVFTTDDNGVTVRLSHDASTDTPTGDKVISAFLSVPIYGLRESYEAYAHAKGIKEVEYPMPVILQWSAQTLEGGPLSIYERKGSYTPAEAD